MKNHFVKWGDINPATGKVEGNYCGKSRGAVTAEESLISEDWCSPTQLINNIKAYKILNFNILLYYH